MKAIYLALTIVGIALVGVAQTVPPIVHIPFVLPYSTPAVGVVTPALPKVDAESQSTIAPLDTQIASISASIQTLAKQRAAIQSTRNIAEAKALVAAGLDPRAYVVEPGGAAFREQRRP